MNLENNSSAVTENKNNVICSTTAKAWMVNEHLLEIKVNSGAVVHLEDAQSHVEIGRQLAEGSSYINMLIDIKGILAISREARHYYSTPAERGQVIIRKAIAIIVKSPMSRVIANFFIGLNKPDVPVKLFNRKKNALEWLEGFTD